MSLFFQPEKRFSNELRVKERKGAAYRDRLRKRQRQKPLPETKLLYGVSDDGFEEMLELRKKRSDSPAPWTKGFDRTAMVLSGFILVLLFAGVFLRIPGVFYDFAIVALIALHVLVVVGQCFGQGPNQKLLLHLFAVYAGLILWTILISFQ